MARSICFFVMGLTLAAWSQEEKKAPTLPPEDRARVYVTDSQSWEASGGSGGSGGVFGSEGAGGARPQTAEIIKTFGERCPDVMVNNIREKANYIVVLDHEGGKGYLHHRNKVAVFAARSGDAVVSKSTLSLGGSVEEACKGITAHWAVHRPPPGGDSTPAPSAPSPAASSPVAESRASGAHLVITSSPSAADIEIDGNFMGNTTSTLDLPVGEHTITIRKSGFKVWERKIKVLGGTVNIAAELEK
ncbi:MAG: PEGA domain-containing protein [Acidobacteriia bacterium]|nr:PEGA domain-containing protein [Terriglobia bacterium]